MIEVSYYVASSLDGFIADAQGGLGWLRPFEGTAEDYGYEEFYAATDAVLLGRATYDFLRDEAEWPYAGKPAWIFTGRALGELPSATEATAASPAEVVRMLESRGLRHAYLVGGGKLAGSFRAERLITRYIVSVVPVVLGDGLPLLARGGAIDELDLVRSQAYESGIVQLEYRVSRM